jgi:hypothetical protein
MSQVVRHSVVLQNPPQPRTAVVTATAGDTRRRNAATT